MSPRFAVLGLATVRSVWPREVTGWAMSGALPIDFAKCVSADEVRARLRSGRTQSAVLVDANALGVDRDLFAVVHEFGAAVIVVGSDERNWTDIGANAQLHEVFSRHDLLDRLTATCSPLGPNVDIGPVATTEPGQARSGGRLVAVMGRGGAGTSTLAAALAQTVADPSAGATTQASTSQPATLLADLARRADQAMLHDATDVVPGVQELVEGHRQTRMNATQIRATTFRIQARGYDLLLGRRRAGDWITLRPRALEAALDGLVDTYGFVVADIDADLEGEDESGSVDIEERNVCARAVVERADAVVIVSDPSLSGIHRLVTMIDECIRFGVDEARLVPVINHAPRSARIRADLNASIAALADADLGGDVASTVFIGSRRHVDDAHRNGTRLPAAFGRDLAAAVNAAVARAPRLVDASTELVPVAVGSLGFAGRERDLDGKDDLA